MTQPLYFVERNNADSRNEKLVHPFDGRVIPLHPSLIRPQAHQLAGQLNLTGVDYIVGFAEGGLIPAFAISDVTGIPFVGSYRVRLKLANEIHFVEQHSERANHFIYGLQPGSSVVLIEDEITTGQTMLNVINQLSQHQITVLDIGVYILNCQPLVYQQFQQLGYTIKYLYSQQDIQSCLPSLNGSGGL